MNSTIGIEYAYTRIHKLELEALAYKDKIAELEKQIAFKIKECQTLDSACARKDRIIRTMYEEMEFKGGAE
jgi:hypothetical protein